MQTTTVFWVLNTKELKGLYPNPNVVQFDEGKEFYDVGVRDRLKSYNVNYLSTEVRPKTAIVERFNRTLKTTMWKYFYSKETYNWVDMLDELTNNYKPPSTAAFS